MRDGDIPQRYFDSIDSTNSEAMRRIAAGEHGPLWVIAGEQSAGKGRSGRAWASRRGNFYGSLIVPLDASAAVVHEVSLLTGVAVIDAIRAAAAPATIEGLRLKWPNDVLIGAAKLAGLLPESTTAPGGRMVVVLGIGINLAAPPVDLGRAVTSLEAAGVTTSPAALLSQLSNALTLWLARWKHGSGFAEVREAWLARAGPIGETLSIQAGAVARDADRANPDRVFGRFAGLASDGALLLTLSDGTTRRFTWGDVTLGTGTPAAD
jgi:BirA family biotin operon repressor/biotin-[acetyl-CoA-carboxylase] ligase